MTEIDKDQLDDQLAQMTRWEGESTELWQKAIDANEAQPTNSFWSPRFLHWRVRPLAAVIAIVGGLLLVATFIAPGLEEARDGSRTVPRSASNLRQLAEAHDSYTGYWEAANQSFARYEQPLDLNSALNKGLNGGGFGMGGGASPGRRSALEEEIGFSNGAGFVAGVTGNGSIELSIPADRQLNELRRTMRVEATL